MAQHHAFLAFALCLLPALAVSGPSNDGTPSCGTVPPRPQYSTPDTSTVGCVCGEKLRNASVPLTKSFRLKAVCNLRWAGFGERPDKTIDLTKEHVSFEDYREDGYIPYGELLLIGTATLRGTLMHEEGPAGEWWFYPEDKPISPRGPLERAFSSLKLTREHSQQEFHAPRSLRKENCWEADAIVKISNIWLTIGETDEAGAYPVKYSITSVSNHRRCK